MNDNPIALTDVLGLEGEPSGGEPIGNNGAISDGGAFDPNLGGGAIADDVPCEQGVGGVDVSSPKSTYNAGMFVQNANVFSLSASTNTSQAVVQNLKTPEQKIQAKYGTLPYKPNTTSGDYQYEWYEYAIWGGNPLAKLFNDLSTKLGITPSELYTVAMGEGLGFYYEQYGGWEYNRKINGFTYLGVDEFYDEAPKLRKKGYLPPNFNEGDEYDLYVGTNEKGESKNSANFKDLQSGLIGFAAVYAHRRSMALTDGTNLGYGVPTADEILFWGYYYYQNPTAASRILKNNKGWSIARRMKYIDLGKPHPDNVPSKAYKRIATWRFIQLMQSLLK